jgi:hypothetical protein
VVTAIADRDQWGEQPVVRCGERSQRKEELVTVIEDVQQMVDEAQRAARAKLEQRRRELDQQIAPLEVERRAVDRALHDLGAKKPSTAVRRPASTTRVSREERHEQVLGLVRTEPGLTTADLGRRLELSSNRATALVKELREAGKLRDGQPLRVVGDQPAAEAPDPELIAESA